jgi:hypothetical protein
VGRQPKKVAVNGGGKLTVFETFFAEGPSAKRGFLFFLKTNLCREPLAKAVGKGGFLFLFLKKTCDERPCQRPSAKTGEDFSQSCRA